jgi:cytochrome o ubiquinol oxidase subunit 2
MITWSIPVLVVLFLGGVTWISAHALDPAQPLKSSTRPLEVQVVSLDWKWLFIYPDQGIAAVNQLTLPVGTPVHFSLTSASVMNSFFIPQLGSMIYTMNGMSDQLNLQADKAGVYYGQSAHFSGDGFSDMHFAVNVVAPQDFGAWIARVRAAGPALDPAAYQGLARQSAKVAPMTYRAVSPGLYQAVATQQIAPAPGPQNGQLSPNVSSKREQ